MEIYLVRHTSVNVAKGLCYGQTDVPLEEPFWDNFVTIKTQLPSSGYKVYASPLLRCKLLAEYLSPLHQVKYDKRLKELSFGEWENILWNKIDADLASRWMQDFVYTVPPEGESFANLYERVKAFIFDLLNHHDQSKPLVIVSHAGVIRCFLCYVLHMPLSQAFKIPVDFGSITKIEIDQDDAYNKLSFLNKVEVMV